MDGFFFEFEANHSCRASFRAGQYGAAHQEDPYNVQNMVSAVVDQYDDLLDTCLSSDPSVDGSDTCSHYYVNSCDLDQSSRDSQVSCVEACVTERFAQTMKGTIDDVSVCAYPVSSTFLLAPNVVKSCMDPVSYTHLTLPTILLV